jgi:copper chaperone CopZ
VAQINLKVGSIYCHDCVLALRKFIGNIKGVQSVDMIGDDRVVIIYEPSHLDLDEGRLKQLVLDSSDKLGFKVLDA